MSGDLWSYMDVIPLFRRKRKELLQLLLNFDPDLSDHLIEGVVVNCTSTLYF